MITSLYCIIFYPFWYFFSCDGRVTSKSFIKSDVFFIHVEKRNRVHLIFQFILSHSLNNCLFCFLRKLMRQRIFYTQPAGTNTLNVSNEEFTIKWYSCPKLTPKTSGGAMDDSEWFLFAGKKAQSTHWRLTLLLPNDKYFHRYIDTDIYYLKTNQIKVQAEIDRKLAMNIGSLR